MNIVQAINDPKVFGRYFKAESWNAWRVFLAALFGLPLGCDKLTLYRQCTGRATAPTKPLNEAWLVVGRRGGKSFVLAVIATFLACFKDWRPYLAPGEVGTIMIIAKDRAQARSIKRYVSGLLRETSMLAPLIESETAEGVHLRNRVVIEVHAASFRSVRGYTVIAALLDEIAFWRATRPAPSPIPRSLTPFGPPWRPSPKPCCSALRARTPVAAYCGTRTASISARTTIRSSSGKPPRGP